MSIQDKAFELEKCLVPVDLYCHAPIALQRVIEQEKGGGPIGLAYKDGMWYVLCSGQGPFVAEYQPGEDPYKVSTKEAQSSGV